MSELAGRIRRPSWKDPRLAVGVLLVALSVALGIAAVGSGRDGVEVWAAVRPLAPGDAVEGAVVAVAVPESLASRYLRADVPPTGVVDRVIGEGELLPRSGLVSADRVDLRTVVVSLGEQVSATVTTGTRVDLWLNPKEGGPARPILEGLTVRAVVEDTGSFGASRTPTLELLVPAQEVDDVLTAMNDGGPLVAVPRAGS